MASFRKHRTKDGRLIYFWRAKVPIKEADGSVVWRDVERSTKSGTLAGAREAARKLEADYHDRAGRPVQEVNEYTFANAAVAYMKSGGERRYLAPILERIGNRPLIDIDQESAQQLADQLKPGCSPATLNRHIFTPLLAVLNYAARLKMCPPPTLVRPKGHDKSPKLEVPSKEWFDAVMPLLSLKVRAVLLLISLHGLRISEAIERAPGDLDTVKWRLTIPDTKNGEPVQLPLSEPVIHAIREMMAEEKTKNQKRALKGKPPIYSKWLFGTGSRRNIARDIAKSCKLANVPVYGTHAAVVTLLPPGCSTAVRVSSF